MKRLVAMVSLALLVQSLSAEAQTSHQPPIPEALKAAKTLYLVNAGIPNRQFEQTVAALTKWARFTMVADADGSDITLTLTSQPPRQVGVVAGAVISTTTLFMSFTATPTGTVLYGTTFTGNPESEFKKLRARMEEERAR